METNNGKKNQTKIALLSVVACMLVATLGVSFAYFTARVNGIESSTTINASSGQMSITFANGNTINATNIAPSATAFGTKTFDVTGTNTTANNMMYKINIVVEENTFTSGAISYTITNTATTGGTPMANVASTTLTTGAGTVTTTGSGTFATGSTIKHTYAIAFYFLDSGSDQYTDMNKSFKAHITVSAVR